MEDDELRSYYVTTDESGNDVRIPFPKASSAVKETAQTESYPEGWISAGTSVTVQNFTLKDGLFYFGKKLSGDHGQIEPSLINPLLSVSSLYVDESLPLTSYWPSYISISSDARRAFLQWMAGGRINPDVNIGYVYLFFYGLERRALHELSQVDNSRNEIDEIIKEANRLLLIYGSDTSFSRYARSFVEFLNADVLVEKSYLQEPPSYHGVQHEMPLAIKIALGQIAVDRVPLSVSWALAWVNADARISKRTPVIRCQDQFKALFSEVYKSAYAEGFNLLINRTQLKAVYRPATGAFWRTNIITKTIGGLPDLSAAIDPANKLQVLVDEVTDLLEPYSRYIRRYPDAVNSFDALLQLPFRIWPKASKYVIDNLQKIVANDEFYIKSYSELCEKLGAEGDLDRDKLTLLAGMFDSMSIGMEPDIRAGSKLPKSDELIVLFSKPIGLDALTPAYHAASVTLDLAAAVALSDGSVCESELKMLHTQIASWVHLSEIHRSRLKARLALRIRQPVDLENIKKKFDPIPQESRRSIGHLLAQLVLADGVIAKEEVTLLERIYSALQLDTQLVYSDLHTSPNIDSDNVSPNAVANKKSGSGFVLNLDRIAALQKETEEVSALLANVFVEDAEIEVPTEILIDSDQKDERGDEALTQNILGLNVDHSLFLKFLLTRSTWTREELGDVASDFELMLDGALEQINEAALDHLDEPLIEGDDPIEINQNLLEKIAL